MKGGIRPTGSTSASLLSFISLYISKTFLIRRMKKIISLVLSLAMVFCVVSVPASAIAKSDPPRLSSTETSRDAGPWFGDVSSNFSIYVPSGPGPEKQFQARVSSVVY